MTEYSLYGVFKPLLRDVEGFPRAISEVPGRRRLAAALRGGAFVYFTAWCDCLGGMCLYAAVSREVLADDRCLPPSRPLPGRAEGRH